jgi:hypothetical protein
MDRGRPTIAKPELVDEICRRIAAGESLRSICRDDHTPALSTVCLWIVDGKHADFSERYAQARQAAGYAHGDRIQEIAQAVESEQLSPQAAKVALDAYKWSAERMAPKAHSPRTIQDHQSSDGSMSPQQEVSDEELERRIRELSGDG